MTGREIAHYRIEALLGAGGMGEVYRARDTRLGRSVAVKMLPDVFASDADRVARFEREAKLLASEPRQYRGALRNGAGRRQAFPRNGACRGRNACRAHRTSSDS